MRWIDDVRSELAALELSARALRRAAGTVGLLLVAGGLFVALRRHAPVAGAALGLGAVLLFAAAALRPLALRGLYQVWMGFAFAVGWLVSRVVLSALFFLVVTPTALLGRRFGARFLDTKPDRAATTYWVRTSARPRNYEQMF